MEMTLFEEIQKAAYALYEKSGRACGKDLENWLEAEKTVKARQAKKELAAPTAKNVLAAPSAVQPAQAASTAAEKVKKAVKKTVTGLRTAAKKKA